MVGFSKGMLPVKYFHSNKDPSLCQLNFIEIIRFHKVEVNLATLSFRDINRFKRVVSVRHYTSLPFRVAGLV